MSNQHRPITSIEKHLIEKLLEKPFRGRDQLLTQLEGLEASELDSPDDIDSVRLHVVRGEKAPVGLRVPVEGLFDDERTPVSVLLHVTEGYMGELEIVPYNVAVSIKDIPLDKIKVFNSF